MMGERRIQWHNLRYYAGGIKLKKKNRKTEQIYLCKNIT